VLKIFDLPGSFQPMRRIFFQGVYIFHKKIQEIFHFIARHRDQTDPLFFLDSGVAQLTLLGCFFISPCDPFKEADQKIFFVCCLLFHFFYHGITR
jgi:hypothetical protein